jgi:hypothetical protein
MFDDSDSFENVLLGVASTMMIILFLLLVVGIPITVIKSTQQTQKILKEQCGENVSFDTALWSGDTRLEMCKARLYEVKIK